MNAISSSVTVVSASAIPVIGVIVCAGLLTQREAEIWLRAGILLLIGLALWAVNLALTRREAQ